MCLYTGTGIICVGNDTWAYLRVLSNVIMEWQGGDCNFARIVAVIFALYLA
jgi:hypothetical protein